RTAAMPLFPTRRSSDLRARHAGAPEAAGLLADLLLTMPVRPRRIGTVPTGRPAAAQRLSICRGRNSTISGQMVISRTPAIIKPRSEEHTSELQHVKKPH